METNKHKNNNHLAPIIFGEVLFDCFPDGNSVLGGAPFNVAWHLQAFTQSPLMISSIGDDELGGEVKSAMKGWHMDTSALQLDPSHPTGSVDIKFDQGEPHYTIVEHRAYDYINTKSLPTLAKNSLLYHGSLALRNQVSRETLASIKASHTGPVFLDVNLRDPWWLKASVLEMATEADWVKLNEDELLQLGCGNGDIKSQAAEFINAHHLTAVIVTLGSKGAIVLTNKGEYVRATPSQMLKVIDTVGAGDALTSVLILGILLQWPLEQSMQRAQDFASLIVAHQGATVHNHAFYQPMISDWNL